MLTVTQTKLINCLNKMIKMSTEDTENAEMFAGMLDYGLDELSCEDAFGTEGQCDPRGDQRNGPQSLLGE